MVCLLDVPTLFFLYGILLGIIFVIYICCKSVKEYNEKNNIKKG